VQSLPLARSCFLSWLETAAVVPRMQLPIPTGSEALKTLKCSVYALLLSASGVLLPS